MVQVRHNEKLVAIINYGWESDTFYKKWMGSNNDKDSLSLMSGAAIDLSSPNLVSKEGVLCFFYALLNDMWVAKFKHHYKAVKAAVSK